MKRNKLRKGSAVVLSSLKKGEFGPQFMYVHKLGIKARTEIMVHAELFIGKRAISRMPNNCPPNVSGSCAHGTFIAGT